MIPFHFPLPPLRSLPFRSFMDMDVVTQIFPHLHRYLSVFGLGSKHNSSTACLQGMCRPWKQIGCCLDGRVQGLGAWSILQVDISPQFCRFLTYSGHTRTLAISLQVRETDLHVTWFLELDPEIVVFIQQRDLTSQSNYEILWRASQFVKSFYVHCSNPRWSKRLGRTKANGLCSPAKEWVLISL